jgi:hypothetical protein
MKRPIAEAIGWPRACQVGFRREHGVSPVPPSLHHGKEALIENRTRFNRYSPSRSRKLVYSQEQTVNWVGWLAWQMVHHFSRTKPPKSPFCCHRLDNFIASQSSFAQTTPSWGETHRRLLAGLGHRPPPYHNSWLSFPRFWVLSVHYHTGQATRSAKSQAAARMAPPMVPARATAAPSRRDNSTACRVGAPAHCRRWWRVVRGGLLSLRCRSRVSLPCRNPVAIFGSIPAQLVLTFPRVGWCRCF